MAKPELTRSSADDVLAQWYQKEPGRTLATLERAVLEQLVARLPGNEIVQIGAVGGAPLVFGRANPVCCRLVLEQGDSEWVCTSGDAGGIHTKAEDLPLRSGTVDLVLLLHAFEFTATPHQLLREAERILRPGGHLIILGFNPLSLLGIARHTGWFGTNGLDRGVFFSRGRLKDWCTMINLEVIDEQSSGFGLPCFPWFNWMRPEWPLALSRHLNPWAGAF